MKILKAAYDPSDITKVTVAASYSREGLKCIIRVKARKVTSILFLVNSSDIMLNSYFSGQVEMKLDITSELKMKQIVQQVESIIERRNLI